jgi:HAE1 family hydrophobic/amphiphilic exporter-1
VLDVRRQSGANTVEMIEGGKGEPRSRQAAAAGRRFGARSSAISPKHIYASLHEINVHLILGSILACLVVFCFMRDWRATVIAAVAIPRRWCSTFG